MMKGVTFCTESVNWSEIAEHNLLFQEPLDKPSGPTFVIVSSGIQPDFLFTVATSCFSPEFIGFGFATSLGRKPSKIESPSPLLLSFRTDTHFNFKGFYFLSPKKWQLGNIRFLMLYVHTN